MSVFMDMVKKGYDMVKNNPRKCDCCGCIERVDNIILKYDNGKYMCDDCAYNFYEKNEEF